MLPKYNWKHNWDLDEKSFLNGDIVYICKDCGIYIRLKDRSIFQMKKIMDAEEAGCNPNSNIDFNNTKGSIKDLMSKISY